MAESRAGPSVAVVPIQTLLYDPYAGGHHPQYLSHIVRYWRVQNWPTDLQLAVPSETLALDPHLSELLEQFKDHVTHVAVARRVGKGTVSSRVISDLSAGLEIRRLLSAQKPDFCLLMYFDHLHVATASLLRGSRAKLAGIYFRPDAAFTSELRMGLLRLAVANRSFDTLFVLDQSAVPRLRDSLPTKVVWLPDGIDKGLIANADSEAGTRAPLTSFVLFGSISTRKGIHVLAEAVSSLDPGIANLIQVTIAGPQAPSESDTIGRSIRILRNTLGSVTEVNRYLSQREINKLCADADVVLAPYVGHSGSSNVLVHAAAAGRPVIATETGLIGRLVRTHRLGATVVERDPIDLARAIGSAASMGIPDFDAGSAREFATANSDEAFAQAVHGEFVTRSDRTPTSDRSMQ